MTVRCAFLTTEGVDPAVADDELAQGPLTERGWQVEEVPWRRPDVDWDAYDVVVVRSAWDYPRDPCGFVRTLERVASSRARLANPLPVLRWNLRKTYLFDLDCWGVRTVPTLWRPGILEGDLGRLFSDLGTDEVVVKPVVGASGEETFRVHREEPRERERAERAFRSREALVQPFQPSILEEGEVSLFFLAGAFSHGVRKVPCDGEFRSQEEHGGRVSAFRPEETLVGSVAGILERLPDDTLYARADLVRDRSGAWAVMELELVEPSLYLRMDPEAPARFARALHGWLQA